MEKIIHRLIGSDGELQELFSSLVAIYWGIIILFCVRASLISSPAFVEMTEFMDQKIWAWILIIFGVVKFLAYVFQFVKLRRIMAIFGVFIWSMISYLMFIDYKPVVGTVVFPLLAVMSALTYWRLGRFCYYEHTRIIDREY